MRVVFVNRWAKNGAVGMPTALVLAKGGQAARAGTHFCSGRRTSAMERSW